MSSLVLDVYRNKKARHGLHGEFHCGDVDYQRKNVVHDGDCVLPCSIQSSSRHDSVNESGAPPVCSHLDISVFDMPESQPECDSPLSPDDVVPDGAVVGGQGVCTAVSQFGGELGRRVDSPAVLPQSASSSSVPPGRRLRFKQSADGTQYKDLVVTGNQFERRRRKEEIRLINASNRSNEQVAARSALATVQRNIEVANELVDRFGHGDDVAYDNGVVDQIHVSHDVKCVHGHPNAFYYGK